MPARHTSSTSACRDATRRSIMHEHRPRESAPAERFAMTRGRFDVERRSIEAVVHALDGAGVRYLIAGGLAVVAHGFGRVTYDLDLVLDPDAGSLARAVAALEAMGYVPRAPVAFSDFVDPAQRESWAREKHMTVFSLASPQHPATEIDLFLEPPFAFDAAHANAFVLTTKSGVSLRFVSLDDLIAMKRRAGRPRDLADIEGLESLRKDAP